MVESKNDEIVVLMKFLAKENIVLEFVPDKVIEGKYVIEEDVFVNYNTGNTYFHITEPLLCFNFYSYGDIKFFALRKTKEDLEKEYPNMPLEEIKEKVLEEALKYKYCVAITDENYDEFTIVKMNKATKKYEKYEDIDMEIYEEKIMYKNPGDFEFEEESVVTYNHKEKDNETIKKMYTFNPYELASKVKEDVLGQDEAIEKIVQSLWCNYYFIDDEDYNKENILLIGPSGVGKTEIFRRIDSLLPNITVLIADLSSVTEAGIVGDSLDDIIKSLLIKCTEEKNGHQFVNVEKAKHSIIVLDEFDKIAMNGSSSTDVGNEPVQQELLKIIEGKEMLIKLTLNGVPQLVPINTKDITFVCCGAFEGINKKQEKQLGFGKDVSQNNTSKSYQEITEEDIKKYGFITELVGRIPSIVVLNELPLEILIQIVKKPRRNLFIKKLKILKSIVEQVEINEDLYEQIAKNALEKKTGARGIDKVSVDLFAPILNEVCNPNYDYQYAMLNKETVSNPKKYELKKTKKG